MRNTILLRINKINVNILAFLLCFGFTLFLITFQSLAEENAGRADVNSQQWANDVSQIYQMSEPGQNTYYDDFVPFSPPAPGSIPVIDPKSQQLSGATTFKPLESPQYPVIVADNSNETVAYDEQNVYHDYDAYDYEVPYQIIDNGYYLYAVPSYTVVDVEIPDYSEEIANQIFSTTNFNDLKKLKSQLKRQYPDVYSRFINDCFVQQKNYLLNIKTDNTNYIIAPATSIPSTKQNSSCDTAPCNEQQTIINYQPQITENYPTYNGYFAEVIFATNSRDELKAVKKMLKKNYDDDYHKIINDYCKQQEKHLKQYE